ncbi:uncharacterized protein LOC62_01G000228 [Vanrija pseudolonga]|uniref:Uncharacterized protein n=1 Tax=Vanrija pseudolonga TaxID=143232 RepID=A0AAF1BEK7_9TREE|nr:hypothetical protein LOC62_01G000228 [Vanrija pseudolonga]
MTATLPLLCHIGTNDMSTSTDAKPARTATPDLEDTGDAKTNIAALSAALEAAALEDNKEEEEDTTELVDPDAPEAQGDVQSLADMLRLQLADLKDETLSTKVSEWTKVLLTSTTQWARAAEETGAAEAVEWDKFLVEHTRDLEHEQEFIAKAAELLAATKPKLHLAPAAPEVAVEAATLIDASATPIETKVDRIEATLAERKKKLQKDQVHAHRMRSSLSMQLSELEEVKGLRTAVEAEMDRLEIAKKAAPPPVSVVTLSA